MPALDLAALVLKCAVAVHPETALAIIQQESKGHPYALNTQVRSYYPETREEAARVLGDALRAGRSTDIGLMQINSQHLRRFNVSGEELLDPCTNIRVGTTILSESYGQALGRYGQPSRALVAALSSYNTGNDSRGVANGYVGKVVRQAGGPVVQGATAAGGTKGRTTLFQQTQPQAARTGFQRTGPVQKESPSR